MSSHSHLLHAIAGALANIFSITLVFPFETARTRLQTQDRRKAEISIYVIRDLVRDEGWSSLYMGWSSLVLSLSVTNFVYFYIFNFFKSLPSMQSIHQDFIFGILAGCSAVVISNPLWVVNTRLKLNGVKIGEKEACIGVNYLGINDCMKRVYSEEGIYGLYAGLKYSLILVLNPAINFMAYEFLKRFLFVDLNFFMSSSLLYFTFGGVAKFIATVTTYPLQVIQTRSRAGLPTWSHHLKLNSLSGIVYYFRGLESKVTQTVLTSSIMFLIYEHLQSLLFSCAYILMDIKQ